MIFSAYRALLKLPTFKGKSRIENVLREHLSIPPVAVDGGLSMELDPGEWTQIDLLTNGIIEPITSKLIQDLLPKGGTFIDVGAHVGFHTINAAKSVGRGGTVIAIDPQPYNCERILRNCLINDIENAVVHVAAVGNQDGFVVLQNQRASDKARLTLRDSGVNDCQQKFVVPIRRLGSIIRDAGLTRVDVLKIDVEGFEDEVLRGLEHSSGLVQNVVFEMLEPSSKVAKDAASLLLEGGFVLKTLTGAPWQVGDTCIEGNVLAQRAS